jgi:Rieske Fe-S protein
VLAEHPRHHRRVGTRTSPQRRRSLLVSLVAVLAVLGGLAVARFFFSASDSSPGAGWVRVGSVQEVRAEGVVLLSELPAYVVADPPRTPITLLARSPHLGERIVYCQSSGWFEDPAHGARFDRLGNYVLGPADRGLDRLATLVQDGVVWVNPNAVTLGPARGSREVEPPAGPFCSGNN